MIALSYRCTRKAFAIRRLVSGAAVASILALCGPWCCAPVVGAEAAATTPAHSIPGPTVNLSVTEWVVFVADAANPQLNARNLFHDSLPSFAEDLRKADSADKDHPSEPGPIGLIRFSADGPTDKDATVDVQLSFKQGRALGHWPRAKVRSAGLLWQDVRLAPDKGEPQRLPEKSWLTDLRGGGLPLLSGSTRESFLLYDVELPYPLTMQVKAVDGGKYSIAQGMDAPLRDLTFYKRGAEKHWRTASLPSLAKAEGFPKQAVPAAKTESSTKTATAGTVVVAQGGAVIAYSKVANQQAPNIVSAPAAAPSVVTKPIKATEIALGPAAETDETVLAPWRAKLTDAGVLPADQDVVLKILARQALDPNRLTAVYRMDPAELDRILPLEVVPQPKKVSRIALVVVRGIDPAIGDELDQLIKKLGDSSWKTREAATNEIKKLGVRAKSRLEEAAKSKDAEVAYRAEQLLSGISTDADQSMENAVTGAAQAIGGFF
ncbi:MAG TPA: hypothetical protein VG056_04980 [Pirellulales bacterium]|jgi:hypothetical protein|nr:hypothetical protein [Pirellulales bacterium]